MTRTVDRRAGRDSRVERAERRSLGDQIISWLIIVGVCVAAALAVVGLYSALVEDQAEPIENIITNTGP